MKNKKEKIQNQNINYYADDFRILVSGGQPLSWDKAFHEAIEIKYFYEGRAMLLIDSDVIVAESGDITIANPYEIHTNIVNDAYMGKYHSLIIDLDFFSDTCISNMDLRQLLLAEHHKFNHHIKNNERLGQIIFDISKEMTEKKEHYRMVISNLLCELFALLLRDELSDTDKNPSHTENLHRHNILSPALQKIFKDYANPITVDELALLCNISKYHFCRIFKSHMGMTVTQYIINYRISLADSMLKDENQSIRDVATACGFEDLSYFYQCYKRIKGTSPGKSRKQ